VWKLRAILRDAAAGKIKSEFMIKIPTSRIETITTNARSIVKLVSTRKVLILRLRAKDVLTLVSIMALAAVSQ
jgi:hypothetical protein